MDFLGCEKQKGWVIKINCELCGKTTEDLNRAIIEGVELNVCGECSKFGKVVSVKTTIKSINKKRVIINEPQKEKIELLVEDFSDIIKKKRESMGLTQKDFAIKINEKESLIHKIETGAFEPSLSLAKKLERILGIKLIEEHEEKHERFIKKREESFNLGDFIKIKK